MGSSDERGACSKKHLEPTGVPGSDKDAVYLTDMTRGQPGSAVTRRFARGAWKAVEYETAEFSGTMLYSIAGLKSPELAFRLDRQGWYAVYLGLHDSHQRYRLRRWPSPLLKVKLSGEEVFQYVQPESFAADDEYAKLGEQYHFQAGALHLIESFWCAADLTGRDLIIAATDATDANIAYIKLVPLSEGEVAQLAGDAGRDDTKRLIGVFDASSLAYKAGVYDQAEMVATQLNAFRDSDFGIVLWGTSCGFDCYYPTRVGDPPRRSVTSLQDPATSPIFPVSDFLLAPDEDGTLRDPLREAVGCGRELGIQIYASVRPEGPIDSPNDEGGGKFYDEHLEYCCTSRQGHRWAYLSLAYPEVRNQWVELLREQVGYGVDGVSFVFVRGFPFVGYDPPVIEAFKQQYDVDPRDLDEKDERWQTHCAGYVTQFLREIRQMLDEEAHQAGRSRLGTAYHVFSDPQESLGLGLDVATWISEGLVDHLLAYPFQWTQDNSTRAKPENVARAYAESVGGSGTRLYAHAWPRVSTASYWLQQAQRIYDAGADGIALFDVDAQLPCTSGWSMVKKLGHRDDLPKWRGSDDRYLRVVPLKSLGGRVVDRFYQTSG